MKKALETADKNRQNYRDAGNNISQFDPPDLKQAKKEYMELLKQFRGKSKVDAMKDMNDDLDKFVKIHSRPKEFNHEDKGET